MKENGGNIRFAVTRPRQTKAHGHKKGARARRKGSKDGRGAFRAVMGQTNCSPNFDVPQHCGGSSGVQVSNGDRPTTLSSRKKTRGVFKKGRDEIKKQAERKLLQGKNKIAGHPDAAKKAYTENSRKRLSFEGIAMVRR